MQTLSTLQSWLTEQVLPVAFIVALFGSILMVLFLSTRSPALNADSIGWSENEFTFINSLLIHGFDPVITRITFRYFQEKRSVGLPIEATDKLDTNLGLGPADVEQLIQELLRLNGRFYEPALTHTALATVEDLVSLIQASPRLSGLAA